MDLLGTRTILAITDPRLWLPALAGTTSGRHYPVAHPWAGRGARQQSGFVRWSWTKASAGRPATMVGFQNLRRGGLQPLESWWEIVTWPHPIPFPVTWSLAGRSLAIAFPCQPVASPT